MEKHLFPVCFAGNRWSDPVFPEENARAVFLNTVCAGRTVIDSLITLGW